MYRIYLSFISILITRTLLAKYILHYKLTIKRIVDGEAVYDEKLGETKVNATNLTAYKFLMIDNVSRIQNYTDINGQNKTGIFWINYEEGEE